MNLVVIVELMPWVFLEVCLEIFLKGGGFCYFNAVWSAVPSCYSSVQRTVFIVFSMVFGYCEDFSLR